MRAHAHARTKALFLTILMVLMVQTPMLSSDFSEELPEIIEPSETTGTAIELEVGGKHSCAYASIRDVKCWGNGSSGQLGIGNSLLIGDEANEMGESLPFSLLGSQFEVHQLALSDTHTCAVNATGAVKCWGEIALLGIGYDDSDGFGDGYIEMGDVLPYLSLPTGRSVDMIEAGGSHTCAVLDNNDLICWGENEAGQLGLGNTTHIGDDADEIGDDFSTVSLPSGRTVDALALGADHTCALLDDASIVCWGDNTYGQLGIGNTNTIGDGAGEMGDSLSTVSLPTGRTATQITAGQDITCAILDNNDLICWGNNDYGQLGQGNTVDVDDPSGLSAISLGSNAQSVDAGVNSVCAVVSNAVKCWGRNTEGQLGLGDTNHRGDGINEMGSNLNSINLASGSISQVEVGDGFACALKSSGAIKCWGSGQEGRLGYGDTAYRGDDSQDMPTDDIDLFLSTTFESEDCARMFVPIHDTFNPEEVDLQAVADLGDLNVLELRSDGCASVVYMDDKSDDQLRFATYENGLWAIEIIPHDADGSIIDIDLTFDGNDVPHIVHIDEDNTLYYSTKSNGRWTTSTSPPSLTQVSGSVAEKAEIVFDGTSLSTYATGGSGSNSNSGTYNGNGTAWMVKDIYTGSPSGFPNYLTPIGNTLYFSASSTSGSGGELWKSDGTESGTVSVSGSSNSGSAVSSPNYLTAIGNTLYFSANDGTNGIELWKSDGTFSGTVMVKDIYSGSSGSSPSHLAVVGNTLYFSATDGSNGVELWKSDGTTSGTVMVRDINSGSSSSSPNHLTAVGNTLYFSANDGPNGTELWKSDGTTSGTVMVKNIYSGIWGSSPVQLTAVGNTLYFQANDGTNGTELWKSDGTTSGTVLVKDIRSGGQSAYPVQLTPIGNTLYFRAHDGTNGAELWKSDGTESGTVMVKDISSGNSLPNYLTAAGNTLYFSATDGSNGIELWKSDGTFSGTVMVKDIYSGSSGSSPIYLTAVGNTVYFRANDGTNGTELWKSDGTTSGTVMVQDINSGGNAGPRQSVLAGNTLYFRAQDGTNGDELWALDPANITGLGGGSGSGSSSWDSDMDSNGDTHFVSSDGNDVTYGVYSGSSYSDVNVDSVTSGHSAIAVGLNGSIHMLYYTTSGLTYAVCHASCLTASNWADQVVTSSGTDVFDLVVDADMVPIVVASQGSTTMAYRLIDGTWASDQIFNFGSAHLSAAVHESGRLWVSSHLEFSGAPDDLYVFNKIGYAGTGINIDGDGDGWTGMDEIRCQTDRFDASSVPADFDGDGICDRFDSKNDLPRVGESSVITVGEDHACAILADSSVSCWGKNDVDQLGDSSTTAAKSAWAVSVDLPADFEAIDVDAGEDHTCAVSRDGDVYCWGSNSDGQLGIGTTVSSSLPSMVQLPAGVRALSVSAGSSHTCITTQGGDVYCWGNGADSQTGESLVADSSAVFTESWESTPNSEWVSSGTPVWSVDTSTSSDGSSSYKSNNHGSSSDAKFSITLLTDGGNISFDYRTITRLNLDFLYFCIDNPSCSRTSYDARWSGTNVWQNYNTSFAAGTHTFTWGYGRSSGSPPAEDTAWVDNISIDTGISRQSGGQSSTPLLLDMPSSVGFIEELATGSRHTCARNTANAVYCWGYNGGTSSMTLGSSTTTATNSSSPVQVDLAGTGSHYATSSNLEFGGMSAGDDVTCAFNSELSESMCWGANLLGNTSSSVNGTRVDMGSSGDAHTSISVGTGHGCGIVAEEAYCWGDNTNGQLGLGSGFPTSSISPMGVQEPNGWTAIEIETSEGGASTCGLFENSGTTLVYCWGDGSQGALGNDASYGSDYGPDAPVKTSSGLANEITPQASSSDLEIAFFRPAQIAAGTNHYCAISVQGLVKCWGYNYYGQLGQGNASQQGHQSNDMGESLAFTNLGTNLTATQIVAGSDHTCALISDGSVKCWGRNDYGQLGQGNSTHQGQQSQQMGDYLAFTDLDGVAIKLAAGAHHTCALMDNGEVKCWGLNYNSGRLGAGTSSQYVGRSSNQMGANLVAVNFGDDLRATDVSAGYVHTCAVLENGLSKCWGYQYSNFGNLLTGSSSSVTWGDSSGDMGTNLPYLDLGTDRATIQISASTQYSCAILDDGNVKCWGYGGYGQLGYGSTSSLGDSSSEVGDGLPYALLGGLTVNQIYTNQPASHSYSSTTSTGTSFACGVMEDGHLRCWGNNNYGQLGIGNTNRIDSTHEMGSNLQVTDVGDFVESAALATQSMCAIRDDGQIRCWGYNGYGQLGHEDTSTWGNQAVHMGHNIPDTNLWLRDDDTDADGTINLWDTDDDNDGYLDGDDDFPIDQCAHLDTDGDGMPNTVASNCLTSLVEDIDDDNDNWWDTNETACQTNPLSSSSVPVDTDGDWLCNFVDTDDDNDGWSDADETMCEPRNAWSSFATGQSGTSNTHVAYNHPTDLIFDDYGLRMAGTGPSSGYPTLWSYTDPAVIGNNPDYTHLGSPGHWSHYSWWRVSGELELYDGYAYTSAANMVYKTEVTPTSFASTSDHQFISSLSQSYHSDMAISSNGTVYATAALDIKWRDQEGNTATIQDPTGAYGYYAQIDVDGNGNLHYIAYSNNLGGLYHWVHDGSSWSASPNYIWGGHQNIMDSRFSEMKIDASGTIHAVFVHNTELVYRYSSNGGASWSTGFTDGRPQSNSYAAVEMVLNSSGAPHFAWLDYSNKTLYHTHQVSGNWVHDVVRTSTQTLSYHSVSLALDANDDPFIHSHETSNTYGTSMIHYRGGFMQDVDANQVPGDADNDGICDVLDQATLDYGDVVQLEVGSTSSVVPMMTGLVPNSVSITPALPSGLTFNTLTGEIFGTPQTSDIDGTTYTISTTSSNDPWSGTIIIQILSESPLFNGYEQLPYQQSTDGFNNQLAFDSTGNMYYASRYYSSVSAQANTQFKTGSSTYLVNQYAVDSNDVFVAKRGVDGTWEWVVSAQLCNGEVREMVSDSQGNTHVLVNFHGLAYSSNCDVEIKGTSIDESFSTVNYMDSMIMKLDSSGNLLWVTPSSGSRSTGIPQVISTDMVVDSNGNVTISGRANIASSANNITFAGMDLDLGTSCIGNNRAFVVRLDANGNGAWAQAAHSFGSCAHEYSNVKVVSHPGGSATITGTTNYGLDFDGHQITHNSYYYRYLAHVDASGNWQWAKNITQSSYSMGTNTDNAILETLSDGSLLFATAQFGNYCSSGCTLNMDGTSLDIENQYYVAAMRLGTDGSQHWTQMLGAWGSHSSSGSMYSTVDGDGMVNILMDAESSPSYWRMFGVSEDGDLAYYTGSYTGSSSGKVSDMGTDYFGQPYFFADMRGTYWGKNTLLNTYSSSGQGTPYSMQLYRMFGSLDHVANHTLIGNNSNVNLPAMGAACNGWGSSSCASYTSWTLYPSPPSGLSFDSNKGRLYGTPNQMTANATYMLNATITSPVTRTISVNITFGIAPEAPTVSWDDNMTQAVTRGNAIVTVTPTITTPQYVTSFVSEPALPAGVNLHPVTGVLSGTPSGNMTTTVFTLKACNSWGLCNEGSEFTLTVLEPLPVISYPDTEYEFPKETPINPMVPTNLGGAVETWEVSPDLPYGLTLGDGGIISGIPVGNTPAANYTIWANNSGGSANVTISIAINGTGMYVFYPYDEQRLAIDHPILTIYPSSLGAVPITWSITPDLPDGLEFGTENGTIWGTPTTLTDLETYTVFAQGFEADANSTTTLTIVILPDMDGDGIPDESDPDSDGDGWYDDYEAECETNASDPNSRPFDSDNDGICDGMDDDDGSMILMVYPSAVLELSLNVTMLDFMPYAAGGDIDTWEISPALPLGLNFDGVSPARSTSHTGVISGTPTELMDPTLYTVWANNSENSAAYTILVSVLTDNDLDGLPDIYDEDDDNDGWSDEMEDLCSNDGMDQSSTPQDTDGDELCNSIDDDDDDDGFTDEEEATCISDPEDPNDTPSDLDGNGVCDALESDTDGDGWADGLENACGTDPMDSTSVPDDNDADQSCDILDDDDDNDGSLDIEDAYPLDSGAHTDTDGDGDPDTILYSPYFGNLVEDMDDDGDGWNDTVEIDCGTEPLNASSTPVDANDNDICDVNDEPEVEGETDDTTEDSESGLNQYLSWTACCILLLLLLLLLLVLLRGSDKSVMTLIRNFRDAEPEHTTSKPVFVFGVGTRDDPFMLDPVEGLAVGSSVESKELITIDNLDAGSIIRFNDMNNRDNEGRFRMDSIEVHDDDGDGNGSIRFRLKFDDSLGYGAEGGTDYEGLIKCGVASVYFQWNVQTKESASDRKAREKAEAEARKAEEARIREEAKAEAKAEAAKEAEKEKKMRAEVEERVRAEAQAKAQIEAEAKAKAEAELKAKQEVAKEREAAERQASKEAAALAQREAEQRLAEMEEKMASKMAEMEQKMEGLSKKEAELARVAAKAEFIDFKTLGVAKASDKDDLQKIKGIGPFIEEKLNALGIYTFLQISRMTAEIEEQVNVAIEFFRGRVRRDKWAQQAKNLHEKKE